MSVILPSSRWKRKQRKRMKKIDLAMHLFIHPSPAPSRPCLKPQHRGLQLGRHTRVRWDRARERLLCSIFEQRPAGGVIWALDPALGIRVPSWPSLSSLRDPGRNKDRLWSCWERRHLLEVDCKYLLAPTWPGREGRWWLLTRALFPLWEQQSHSLDRSEILEQTRGKFFIFQNWFTNNI